MERENFYILLELPINPPETDTDKINAAIAKKRSQWSSMRNHPKKARTAQLYMDLLPKIKDVMMDEDKRRKEAKEAKAIAAKKEKETFQQLDAAIGLLSSKKNITEDEVKKLSQKFSLSEEVIKKRIKVPIIKGQKKAKTERLDASVEEKISDLLKIIGKISLYDFLELSPTSGIKLLQDRTMEKDRELKKVSLKDAKFTACGELAGQCMNIFKEEKSRNKYDASLAYQQLDRLDKDIEIAGLNGVIEVEEFETLMNKAMGMGLKYEEAEEHISEYGLKRKWKVRIPTRPSIQDMKQCGFCGLINKSENKNCHQCGSPLEVFCPNCGKNNSTTNKSCSKCGFAIGDMLNALPLLKSAKTSKNQGNTKKTADYLRKVLHFWPNHPEAAKMLQEIEEKEKVLQQVALEIEQHVNRGNYYGARRNLFKLKQMEPTHPQLTMEAKINARIEAAEDWVKKANAAGNGDDALDFYCRALQESKDCREAVEGMSKYPPAPPDRLDLNTTPRSFALQWGNSTSRGDITYRIARKAQMPPMDAGDGEELGETAQTRFDDPAAEPGVIYYYGIYSKRGGVYSKSGAIAGPLMRTADVENVTVTPGDARLELAWNAPKNAGEIVVMTKDGKTPAGKEDGQPVRGVRRDGVVITGLTNGRTYGFLILTTYENENGRQVYSAGVTGKTAPVPPPAPVDDMAITRKGKQIVITWTPPQRGTVQLFQSGDPFLYNTGDTIPTTALTGTRIPVQTPGKTQLTADFQGMIHIQPVSVEGDVAVVGKSGTITSIDTVSHLKGEINSGRLFLEWQWPAAAQKVTVLYNNRRYPASPEDPDSVKKVFTRADYLKNASYTIRTVEPVDYYFTVYVMAGEGEKLLYSEGSQCMVNNSGLVELYYEILLTKNFLGKVKAAELKLYSKDKTFKIPAAQLVKKQHNLPLRKSDGIPILDIQPMMINTSARTIDIPTEEIRKGTFARLFFKEEEQHRSFRVMSPAKQKLQLG
jgi:hypothetical protein